MQHDSLPHIAERGLPEARRLSYKFQRIREQLRQAIRRGDFSGQLPGERELGRRLEANAKTINKALCDLASEGLLVRVIGRGTSWPKETVDLRQNRRKRSFICSTRSIVRRCPTAKR